MSIPARCSRFLHAASLTGLTLLMPCGNVSVKRLQAAEPAAKPAVRTMKPKPAPAAPTNSLDDALLKDLDNELLEGVNDPPAKRPSRANQPADTKTRDGQSDDEQSTKGDKPAADDAHEEAIEGEDIGGKPEEPLMRIGQQMRTVERLIERQTAGAKAEQLQEQIVADLTELIKKLEEQSQNSQSSSDSKPQTPRQTASRDQVKQPQVGSGNPNGQGNNQPAKESSERLGKNDVQRPDMNAVQGLMKDIWGQLPAHAREQMLQSSPERFLPKYELLIEKYYKRLAEEQKQKP
jgi:hypothetical protein